MEPRSSEAPRELVLEEQTLSPVTCGPAKTGSQSMADRHQQQGVVSSMGKYAGLRSVKGAPKLPNPRQHRHVWGSNLLTYFCLWNGILSHLKFVQILSVQIRCSVFIFFSLTISSFACGNCQKQSRKKEQFLIKPHVSADLLVPRPSCAFSMFYLHYLLWLWAAATADLLSMGWQAGMGTDGCILESFFKQFCVSIPMSQVLCLFNNKKIHQWPKFWWCQCLASYSYPEKCQVTFGMCLIKATKSEHPLWSRWVSSPFMQGFNICAHQLCLLFTKAQSEIFLGQKILFDKFHNVFEVQHSSIFLVLSSD